MTSSGPGRSVVTWGVLAAAIVIPMAFAAASPLLQWRDPAYIAAGFAGIAALALLLIQPLLAAGDLPGLAGRRGRHVHHWTGGALLLAVVLHVAGLWITSPPDVIDALLFAAPTWFSVWGVIAMWAVFASALLAALRWRLALRLRTWRRAHLALASVIVAGSAAHALLIEGTMEFVSKAGLCALAVAATVKVVADLRPRLLRSR